jgi:GNAT superfamily N-acetyltransferase
LFDANCPTYFAPNERLDYLDFLGKSPVGYEVCVLDDLVVGGFGVFDDTDGQKVIRWILLSPGAQGMGIGSDMMQRALRLCRNAGARRLKIATSPRARSFFARFGATEISTLADGWGPGMDRVDMEITFNPPAVPEITLPAGED